MSDKALRGTVTIRRRAFIAPVPWQGQYWVQERELQPIMRLRAGRLPQQCDLLILVRAENIHRGPRLVAPYLVAVVDKPPRKSLNHLLSDLQP